MYKAALKQHDNFVLFKLKMPHFIQRNHVFHLVSCCYKVFGKTSDTSSYGNVGHAGCQWPEHGRQSQIIV